MFNHYLNHIFITFIIIFLNLAIINNAFASSEIIQSQYDEKDYLAFSLENQLEVLVISDSNSDVGAASLLISAGKRTSPIAHLGLPHLLEHAVFLGSKNFPQKSEFDRFVKSHRGWSNGSTRTDNTRYHFQVTNQALDEGLARLADFIAFPLLTEQGIETARIAVDNEFQGRTSNWRRTLAILQQESNPKHPSAKFGTGNKQSLSADLSTLKKALTKFHQQYYGTQNMTLVVYGKSPVNTLKSMVTKHFSQLKKSSLSDKKSTEPRHLTNQLASQIELDIQSDIASLDIRFEVPASSSNFPYNQGAFANYLISHEAKGSLYAYLKKQGFINRLQGEVQGNRYYGILALYLQLTDKGAENTDKVVESVFAYIDLLKAQPLPSWVSYDVQVQNQRAFDLPTEKEPGDWISDISYDMHLYPKKNWLNKQTVNAATELSSYLAKLTPQNMQLVISHSNTAPRTKANKLEPIYNTPYRVSGFSKKQLALWGNAKAKKGMFYPAKNPYFAKSSVKSSEQKSSNNPIQMQPELTVTKPGISLWSQHKTDINVDKISAKLRIYNDPTKTNELVNLVHSKVLQEHLFDTEYFALLAGFNFDIKSFAAGYTIELNGYRDNYFDFLTKLTSLFFQLKTSEQRFNYAKRELLYDIDYRKNYYRPYQQVERAIHQALLSEETDDIIERKLEELSYQEYLQALANNKKFQLSGVFTGDINDKNLLAFADDLQQKHKNSLTNGLKKPPQVKQLPVEHQIKEVQIAHNDASMALVIQAHSNSIEDQANFFLANSILHRKYYHNIRTDNDLAYFVHMKLLSTYQSANLVMVAQSGNSTAEQLQQASSNFLQDYKIPLEQMSDAAFKQHVSTAISKLNDAEFHLSNYTRKLEKELYSTTLETDKLNTHPSRPNTSPFNYRQNTITALKALTKEAFVKFYHEQIMANTSKRLLLFSSGNTSPKDIAKNTIEK